jgi:hypothetical protein
MKDYIIPVGTCVHAEPEPWMAAFEQNLSSNPVLTVYYKTRVKESESWYIPKTRRKPPNFPKGRKKAGKGLKPGLIGL